MFISKILPVMAMHWGIRYYVCACT